MTTDPYQWPESTTAALGTCQCGCGTKTGIARGNDESRGHVAGQPFRYIQGHWARHLASDVAGRFFPRVEKTDSCWLWTGAKNAGGYGILAIGPRRAMAHRWSYEHHIGPIPDGLVLDHLCRVHNCVRPDHLEPVTNAENIRRGEWGQRTHCAQGHEYTPENTIIRQSACDPTPFRLCRKCRATRNADNRKRRKERNAVELSTPSVLAGLHATTDADQKARETRLLGGAA